MAEDGTPKAPRRYTYTFTRLPGTPKERSEWAKILLRAYTRKLDPAGRFELEFDPAYVLSDLLESFMILCRESGVDMAKCYREAKAALRARREEEAYKARKARNQTRKQPPKP